MTVLARQARDTPHRTHRSAPVFRRRRDFFRDAMTSSYRRLGVEASLGAMTRNESDALIQRDE
jgi:hypothetical protein